MKHKQPIPIQLKDYLTEKANSETPLVLATVIQAISPTSAKPGDKALVSADNIVDGWIGGGCAQPAVIKAANKALADGETRIIRIGPKGESQVLDSIVNVTSTCLSGGTLVVFIEPLNRQPSLCVFGHSPVAINVCSLAKKLDFSVTIVSPELSHDCLPEGVSHKTDFSDNQSDFIVIATQGKRDKAAITAALDSRAEYISMVSSEKKIMGLKNQLLDTQFDQTELDRIQGPAGIYIGAKTPAEIALSVLADIVKFRRTNSVTTDQAGDNPKKQTLKHKQAVNTEQDGCCAE